MITGELKNKIDGLWDIFASGGLVNPLDVIEQITYLMFIHDLDDTDNLRAREDAMLGLPHKSIFADEVTIGDRTIDGNQLKWSTFRDFPAGKMYSVVQEWVFPFIKNLHADKDSAYSKYMDDAIFKLPTPLLLDKVVTSLDDIYELMKNSADSDVRGDVYEYLLNKIAQSGLNGQFRTPRHIIKMMVAMMQPKPEDVICDPACGTSGFLVSAGEYLKENHKEDIFFNKEKKDHYMNSMFFGYDMDRTMLRIGAMNMMTHGIDSPFIEYRDSLSDQNADREKYSLILANPPFKGSLDYDIVSADLLKMCKTKKTELLFLALFLRMLKTGGRCACIVPDGVLFGSSTAHKAIRREIIENNRLEAVVSMPSGVFKPYAGVSTAVLIFTKTGHGGTDKVWFYDMKADGFSLDDKRTPVAENDIPDIIERFHSLRHTSCATSLKDGGDKAPSERELSATQTEGVINEYENPRTAKSFMVDKQDIVNNDYDLSINKYKETEYVPVEYPSTTEIMADINRTNNDIIGSLKVLTQTLNTVVNVKMPLQNVASAMDKLNEHIEKAWWAVVLETNNEKEWLNKKYHSTVMKYIDGQYGFDYIKKYITSKLNEEKISEAIKCYDENLYYACACVLATLVEEQLIQYDILTSTALRKRFEKFIEDNSPWIYATFALERFYENFTFDTRGTQYAFDKQEPEFLNRNWLLHGRMKHLINQFDCLQLFCALYAILTVENGDL